MGSFGPGGAIAILTEKLCRAMFYEGYELVDPDADKVEVFNEKAKKQRAEFVEELFRVRGRLTREMNSFNVGTRHTAYEELQEIIERHVKIISKTEKGRLIRERQFFKDNALEYQKRLKASKRVEADTTDNLVKMALHIV